MRGDFSRSTFRPEKHYSGVRLQQGRLQTEADANEAQDIFAWRTHTQTLDSLGLAAGEQASAGFALAAAADGLPLDERAAAASREPLPPGDFFISKGRYYVDGQLCVNEA